MADAGVIQPDTEFIRRVLASGGGDLKKCYQCATCTVACELSEDDAPFPRKQMLEAQWGLKERVVSDPALWLCHNCGKCTEQCPRGAHPGDVFGALRREAVRYFAFPRFLGALAANPKALPVLFLLPVLIFAAIVLWAPKPAGAGPFEFGREFPASALEPLFFAVCGFAVLAFVIGIVRFLRALGPPASRPAALAEIATHERFAVCGDTSIRTAHLLTFYGFAGLALVGTVLGIGTMAGLLRTPLALTSVLKIFANAAAVTALAGVLLLVIRRVRGPHTYFDWLFLGTLAGAVITGIASEILRLAEIRAMFAVYFVHLTLVLTLLLYAPYSKFAHLAYRTVALAAFSKPHQRS
jgi:quinone-modifying oxidoreductase subunit QmoC